MLWWFYALRKMTVYGNRIPRREPCARRDGLRGGNKTTNRRDQLIKAQTSPAQTGTRRAHTEELERIPLRKAQGKEETRAFDTDQQAMEIDNCARYELQTEQIDDLGSRGLSLGGRQ